MRRAGRVGVFGVVRTGLLVVCAVLVTTAGACREEEPEGPPPSPSELTGVAFPAGAETSGIDAVLGVPRNFSTSAGPCYFMVAVAADGSARSGRACGESALIAANGDYATESDQVGDYGVVDGQLTVRTVEWGSIEESYRLTEYIFGPCAADGTAVRDMGRGGGSYDYDQAQAWQLVDGAFGAEVATDDSCWSVTRNVSWIGV